MRYKHAVLGGTFDHLHKGHLSHLKTSAENSKRLSIGLTTGKMVQNKILEQTIELYELRKKELLRTIHDHWPDVTVEITPIEEIFGPSVIDPTIDVIVVTEQTLANGKKINEERKKKGIPIAEIVLAPMVYAEDGSDLSSSRIRMGQIDRQGRVYELLLSRTLHLPDSLRDELRKPLGTVVRGDESNPMKTGAKAVESLQLKDSPLVIAVGDIVSESLEKSGFNAGIKIIDYKTQRKYLPMPKPAMIFDLKNEAGTINSSSAPAIKTAIQKYMKNTERQLITVDGEEDLLVLPAVLLAPLESVIIYGQRELGMVGIRVTEETKQIIRILIERFK